MPSDLLIGALCCVGAVGFALRELADRGSGPGRVLHLQHGRTRRAELSEAALEVLVQVAVKNRVQTAAAGQGGGEECVQRGARVCVGVCERLDWLLPVGVAQGDAEVPGDGQEGGAGDFHQSGDDDEDVDGRPAHDEDGDHHQDHAGDPPQIPVLLLFVGGQKRNEGWMRFAGFARCDLFSLHNGLVSTGF